MRRIPMESKGREATAPLSPQRCSSPPLLGKRSGSNNSTKCKGVAGGWPFETVCATGPSPVLQTRLFLLGALRKASHGRPPQKENWHLSIFEPKWLRLQGEDLQMCGSAAHVNLICFTSFCYWCDNAGFGITCHKIPKNVARAAFKPTT